jgi:hypothetical protein
MASLPAEVVPETHCKPVRTTPRRHDPAGAARDLTALLMETARTTADETTPARRMAHQANSTCSLLVLVAVPLGNRQLIILMSISGIGTRS